MLRVYNKKNYLSVYLFNQYTNSKNRKFYKYNCIDTLNRRKSKQLNNLAQILLAEVYGD